MPDGLFRDTETVRDFLHGVTVDIFLDDPLIKLAIDLIASRSTRNATSAECGIDDRCARLECRRDLLMRLSALISRDDLRISTIPFRSTH